MVAERKVELKRGLRDVYIEKTQSSFIDGKEGKLLYRGYNIDDLATHSTFEEIVYLLLYGSLPNNSQSADLDAQLKSNRALPGEILQIIASTKAAHPMDVLRTAVSAMGSFDVETGDDSPEANLRKGVRLIAAAPTIVASHARMRDAKEAVEPSAELGHAANFLYMLSGEAPDPEDARLIDKDLVLHAEHGVNASTFALRVAVSTRADLYAAVTAAIATLKGPLHGGAAEAVMKMSMEIGSEDRAADYVNTVRKSGGRVMGFGHAVYRTIDPRSVHLKQDTKALSERKGQPRWFSIIEAVTKEMEPYARRGVHPNVDLWAGAIYYLLGIPEDLFIPVFALGRTPGWIMHAIEQYASKDLMRPRLLYTGPMDVEYVPADRRNNGD